jgi:hypothetical protein
MSRATIVLILVASAGLVARDVPTETGAQPEAQASFAQGQSVADRTLADLNSQGVGALAAPTHGTLIAEGDSWFSYPGLDVLGALGSGKLQGGIRYRVFSAASAGDTVESMAYDGEQLEDFAGEFRKVRDAKATNDVKAILISGGGNDIAGREFHMLLNHASSSNGASSPLDRAVANAFIDRIGRDLESLIGTADRFAGQILGRQDIPILIHGYARPVPDGRPFLIGWPLPGPWLQPGFSAKGYVREDPNDLPRNTKVMGELIDLFNARVARIPNALTGIADVRYVDVTPHVPSTLANEAYKKEWSNELHPRDVAFLRVAQALQQRIPK